MIQIINFTKNQKKMTTSQRRGIVALTQNDMEVDNLGFLNNQLIELSIVGDPDFESFDLSDDESDSKFSDKDITELF